MDDEAETVEPTETATEESASYAIAASWGGIKVVFRGPLAGVNGATPTIAQLEDAIRTGLAAVFGDEFEISVSSAERTDK